MKKRVYIAHPITIGDLTSNINRSIDAFRELMRLGFAPMCPGFSAFAGGINSVGYAEPEILPNGTDPEDWMDVDLPWVSVAEALLRLPGESTGADREAGLAAQLGIPVFYTIEELRAWAGKCEQHEAWLATLSRDDRQLVEMGR